MTNAYDTLKKGKLSIGGYADVYYGYDFNSPSNSERPYFVSSNRHNEVTVNLAFLDFKYTNEAVRAHIAPGFGTYMNSNYAQEKGSLSFLMEANVGVLLNKKRDIWLDAGVLPSPYSNESAISRDHLMYSRSLASEYVPYYLSGLKLSLPLNRKINSFWYLLNGWQTIQDNNKSLAFGSQFEFRPNNKLLVNWDTYIGDESSKDHPEFRTRYFSDIYAIFNPEGKVSLTSCFYYGYQEIKDSNLITSYNPWGQANIQARLNVSKKSSLSARLEVFDDPNSVQVTPITGIKGFNCASAGLCYTLKINSNALFRLEGRYFESEKNIYLDQKRNLSKNSLLFISNLTVWF
ncbi:MAG: porin [Bacteroidia bacterium]|nr:porin [Bacteroidia bacterium]